MKLAVTAFLTSFVIRSFGFAYAQECRVQANIMCTITDTRDEFAEFQGMQCLDFQTFYKIDREKASSGGYDGPVDANGYPFVKTKWTYEICNQSTEKDSVIQLTHWKPGVGVFFKGSVRPLNDKTGTTFGKGLLDAKECKQAFFEESISAQTRYYPSSLIVKAKSKVNRSIQCEDDTELRMRFAYEDDCKLQASTSCTLLDGSGADCNGNIGYQTPDDCTQIPVKYEWKICNLEARRIKIIKKKSKAKLDGANQNTSRRFINPSTCWTHTKEATIGSCDRSPHVLTMQARGQGEQNIECQSNSKLSVRVSDPEPSAMPSPSPTLSLQPSPEPTISFQPTTSIKPTSSPTNIASPNPTISINPTSIPTFSPSDAPSLTPTQSPSDIPSTNPSINPSKSMNPSSSPTITIEPSQMPSTSTLPSVSPTKSDMPSISLSPTPLSDSPSNVPSNAPSACEDDETWVTTEYVKCDGLSEHLCTYYSTPEFIINGKVANDACCICGGSQLYELPSSQPSQCENIPDWKDEAADVGCDAYVDTSEAVCEAGTSDNGVGAVDACCECGGGTHISPVPSLAPSSLPSNAPSECIDDNNWDVFYNSDDRNCAFIEGTLTLCTLDTIGSNGKTAKEACCVCGGGLQTSVSPSVSLSLIPSSAPSQCEDVPNWKTSEANGEPLLSCSDIRTNCIGLGGILDDNGVSGNDACCGCGGGTHISPVPSFAPSSLPSNAPSECIDDNNWDVLYNSDDRNCAFIEGTSVLCGLDTIGSNGKTAKEACCICGGGLQTSVSPSVSLSLIPSSAPSQCEDVPNWKTSEANGDPRLSCSDIRTNCIGLGGILDDNGVSGNDACCGCGGGTHISPVPSFAPSSIPSKVVE